MYTRRSVSTGILLIYALSFSSSAFAQNEPRVNTVLPKQQPLQPPTDPTRGLDQRSTPERARASGSGVDCGIYQQNAPDAIISKSDFRKIQNGKLGVPDSAESAATPSPTKAGGPAGAAAQQPADRAGAGSDGGTDAADWVAETANALTTCMTTLRSAVRSMEEPATPGAGTGGAVPQTANKSTKPSEEEVHTDLITAYSAFRNLRRWDELLTSALERRLRAAGPGAVRSSSGTQLLANLQGAYAALHDDLYHELKVHHLAQPFAGILDVGASAFQTAGTAPSLSAPTASASATGAQGSAATSQPESTSNTGKSTSALATVTWESKHFGFEKGRHTEISIVGRLGVQPALTLLEPGLPGASSAATTNGTAAVPGNSLATPSQTEAKPLSVDFQRSVAWGMGTRLSYLHSDNGHVETGLLLRIGQTVPLDSATVIDRGANSYIAVPLKEASQARLFTEVGTEFTIYPEAMKIVHLEKSGLTPLFNIGAGWRHDGRFSKTGRLASLNSPDRRAYLRFMFQNIPLIRADTGAETPLTLGFGFEYERPWFGVKGDTVPAGGRIIIRGDLNLLRAFNSEGSAAKSSAAVSKPAAQQ